MVYGPEQNDLVLQLRKNHIGQVIRAGLSDRQLFDRDAGAPSQFGRYLDQTGLPVVADLARRAGFLTLLKVFYLEQGIIGQPNADTDLKALNAAGHGDNGKLEAVPPHTGKAT